MLIDEFHESVTSIENRCNPLPPSNDGENWILKVDDVISDTTISVGVSGLPLKRKLAFRLYQKLIRTSRYNSICPFFCS